MPIVKCDKCGKEFEVKERTFKEKKYSSNQNQWLCRSCKLIGTGGAKKSEAVKKRWANMSEEDRLNYSNKMKDIWNNKTDEEKEELTQRQREGYNNMDPEKREAMLKKKSENKKRWYKETDPEYIAAMNKRISDTVKSNYGNDPSLKKKLSELGRARWEAMSEEEQERLRDVGRSAWENKSDSEKFEMRSHMSEAQKRRWDNMPEEERSKAVNDIIEAGVQYRASMSDEDKAKALDRLMEGHKRWLEEVSTEEMDNIRMKISESSKEYWRNMSREKYNMVCKDRSLSALIRWGKMSKEEFLKWDEKRREGIENAFNILNTGLTESETDFMNILAHENIRSIPHVFNTMKHPDFDKEFSINPSTKSNRVSPYHQWDFMIDTPNGSMYIDVDGAIHDPSQTDKNVTYFNGSRYSLKELIISNDSKRPYQTDGLQSYAILCYDDNLNDNTPVININTNEKMTFKDLMNIIRFKNMNKKEREELLKEL